MAEQIYRKDKVAELTGLAISTIYWKASVGDFPRPIKLGPRASGWLASEVEAWIAARAAESRGEAA